jgi:hypothetical protein
MCEIQATLILAEQFAEIFDGLLDWLKTISLSSFWAWNRDSEIVAPIFDERNRCREKP